MGLTEIGNIHGFSYSVRNTTSGLESSIDFPSDDFASYRQRPITVTYSNDKGFRGIARNNSFYETVTADVDLQVTFDPDDGANVNYLTIGKDSGLDFAGRDYGHIEFSNRSVNRNGEFSYSSNSGGGLTGSFQSGDTIEYDGGEVESITNTTTVDINGNISNDAQYVGGNVEVQHRHNQVYRNGVTVYGVTSLVGVFVAEED